MARRIAAVAVAILLAAPCLVRLVSSQTSNTETPLIYAAKVVEAESDAVCPSTETVRSEINQEVRSLLSCGSLSCLPPPCEVGCSCRCGDSGQWRRQAFLNMSDPNQQCPPQWQLYTSPARSCGRITDGSSCDSATYSSSSMEYSRICGRIKGYSLRTPDGLGPHGPDRSTISIDNPYLDGISVTRGSPRQHVWSFVAAAICPCTSPDNININVPSYVGENYFCENGGDFNDPLWDGEGCSESRTCECSFNDPPWFCLALEEATADDIEVRICGDQVLADEDIPIELIEIYVQ